MNEFLIPAVYIVLSMLVGIASIGRRPGFMLGFIGSLLLTPYLMFLVLYLTVWRRNRLSD